MALPPLYAGRQEPPRALVLPGVDPRATGAAIAEGLGQIGEAGSRYSQAVYDSEAAQQASAFGVRAAEARVRLDALKADMDPGAPDYEEKYGAALDGERDRLFAGLTNGRAQQGAIGVWANYAGGERAAAQAASRLALAKRQGQDLKGQSDIGVNRSAGLDDPGVEHEIAAFGVAVDAWTVDDDQKRAARREMAQAAWASAALARAQRDPTALLASIAKGDWDARLDPRDRERITKTAEVKEDEYRNKAEQAAQQERQQRLTALDTREAYCQTHECGFDDWSALSDGYRTLDKPEQAVRAAAQAEQAAAGAKLRGQAPARLASLVRTLPDGPERRAAEAEHARMASAPLIEALARGGRAPPPLDIDNPASVERYKTFMRAGAATLGRSVEYLDPDTAAGWRLRAAQSDTGRVEALEYAGKWGDASGAVARQMLPDDPAFAGLVGLAQLPYGVGKVAAAAIVGGKKVTEAFPDLMSEYVRRDAVASFDAYVGDAFSATPGGAAMRKATLDNGLLAYATNMQAAGQARSKTLNRAILQRSFDQVLGGHASRDGYGGGIGELNGAPLIRPTGWTQDAIEKVWFRAGTDDFKRAGDGAELAAGSNMSLAAMKATHPQPIDDVLYVLRKDDGTIVKRADGRAFTIRFDKLRR